MPITAEQFSSLQGGTQQPAFPRRGPLTAEEFNSLVVQPAAAQPDPAPTKPPVPVQSPVEKAAQESGFLADQLKGIGATGQLHVAVPLFGALEAAARAFGEPSRGNINPFAPRDADADKAAHDAYWAQQDPQNSVEAWAREQRLKHQFLGNIIDATRSARAKAPILEDPNPRNIVSRPLEMLTGLLPALGSGPFAPITFAVQGAGSTYDQVLTEGGTPGEALRKAATVGLIDAVLARLGFPKILKKTPKGAAKKALSTTGAAAAGAGIGGGASVAHEAVVHPEEMKERVGRAFSGESTEDDSDYWMGLADALIAAGLVGGGLHVGKEGFRRKPAAPAPDKPPVNVPETAPSMEGAPDLVDIVRRRQNVQSQRDKANAELIKLRADLEALKGVTEGPVASPKPSAEIARRRALLEQRISRLEQIAKQPSVEALPDDYAVETEIGKWQPPPWFRQEQSTGAKPEARATDAEIGTVPGAEPGVKISRQDAPAAMAEVSRLVETARKAPNRDTAGMMLERARALAESVKAALSPVPLDVIAQARRDAVRPGPDVEGAEGIRQGPAKADVSASVPEERRPAKAIYSGEVGLTRLRGDAYKKGVDALRRAKQMARSYGIKEGVRFDRRKDAENQLIREATGLFMGPEGKWRRELDDSKVDADINLITKPGEYKLGDLLRHPDLYAEHPSLADVPVKITEMHPDDYGEVLTKKGTDEVIGIRLNSNNTAAESIETLLHEAQHLVSDAEGFTKGSTTRDLYYHRNMGEIEAEDVSYRSSMSKYLRNKKQPYTSSEYYKRKWEMLREEYASPASEEELRLRTRKEEGKKQLPAKADSSDAGIRNDLSRLADINTRLREIRSILTQDAYLSHDEQVRTTSRRRSLNEEMATLMREADRINKRRGLTKVTNYDQPSDLPPLYERGTKDYVDIDLKGSTGVNRRFPEKAWIGVEPKPPRFSKPGTPGAKVEAMYEKAEAEGRHPMRNVLQALRREVDDRSANIKGKLRARALAKKTEAGKRADARFRLIRGATPNGMRVAKEYADRMYKGLTADENRLLARVIQSIRTLKIASYKDVKHPEGLVSEHRNWLNDLPPALRTKLEKRANEVYFEAWKKMVQMARDARIISEQHKENLLKRSPYSPRHFFERLDPTENYDFGGKKRVSISSSGFEPLTEGSYSLMEIDPRAALTEGFTRTFNRIAKNNANRELWTLAGEVPDNGFVKRGTFTEKEVRTTEDGRLVIRKERIPDRPPKGWTEISVMHEDVAHKLWMRSDMAEEWVTNDPVVNTVIAELLGIGTGTKLFKVGATGWNPIFGVVNALFFDPVGHWMTSDAYARGLPRAIGQRTVDMIQTAKQAWTEKGPLFEMAANEGFLMSGLTRQGFLSETFENLSTAAGGRGTKVGHKLGSMADSLARIENVLGKIGQFSETWGRLSVVNRELKNGKQPFEAVAEARSLMDYSEGGRVVKFLDAVGFPYLNAGVLGLKKLGESLYRRPVSTSAKAAQVIGISYLVSLMSIDNNEEAWDEITANTKSRYQPIIYPLPSVLDEKGRRIWLHFKVPVSHSARPFVSIGMQLANITKGKPVDKELVAATLKDLATVHPDVLQFPIVKAYQSYFANWDPDLKQPTWQGPKVSPAHPELEILPGKTHPFWIEAGKEFGMSPERLQRAAEKIFTNNNTYSALLGRVLKPLMEDAEAQSTPEEWQGYLEWMSKQPEFKRFVGRTNPYVSFMDDVEMQASEEEARRLIQDNEFMPLVEGYYKDRTDENFNKVIDFIQNQEAYDVDRLIQTFKGYEKIANNPDKAWWLTIAKQTPEVRARLFYSKWNKANDEEKNRMTDTAIEFFPSSDRFWGFLWDLGWR